MSAPTAFTRPMKPAVRLDFDVVLVPQRRDAKTIPLSATHVNDRACLVRQQHLLNWFSSERRAPVENANRR
jgi:hypothetical protein